MISVNAERAQKLSYSDLINDFAAGERRRVPLGKAWGFFVVFFTVFYELSCFKGPVRTFYRDLRG